MSKSDYWVGQPVRVDRPQTYGKIVEILKEPIHFHKDGDVVATYKGGGVVIKYMTPFFSLGMTVMRKQVKQSIYPFESKTFGKAFHIIDPRQEIPILEQRLKGDITPEQHKYLKRAIDYLKEFIPKIYFYPTILKIISLTSFGVDLLLVL